MNRTLKVRCPHCDHVFSYYESEFRPFCSEKCKMIDLGHWFEETYRVAGKEKIAPDQNQLPEQWEDEEYEAENYEQSYDEDENESDYES